MNQEEHLWRLRQKLEKEHCMTHDAHGDAVWRKALEHGLRNGLSDVEYWYEEFMEVLR